MPVAEGVGLPRAVGERDGVTVVEGVGRAVALGSGLGVHDSEIIGVDVGLGMGVALGVDVGVDDGTAGVGVRLLLGVVEGTAQTMTNCQSLHCARAREK